MVSPTFSLRGDVRDNNQISLASTNTAANTSKQSVNITNATSSQEYVTMLAHPVKGNFG